MSVGDAAIGVPRVHRIHTCSYIALYIASIALYIAFGDGTNEARMRCAAGLCSSAARQRHMLSQGQLSRWAFGHFPLLWDLAIPMRLAGISQYAGVAQNVCPGVEGGSLVPSSA